MIFHELDEDEFDIFFRHYLRQWAPKKWMSYSEYGDYVGLSTETIEGLACGRISPNIKILNDISGRIKSTKTKQRYRFFGIDYENSI